MSSKVRALVITVKLVDCMETNTWPQRAPPTSALAPSARPFVSVVGPHLKWSTLGHKRLGGQREHGVGGARRGPVSACAFSCSRVLLTVLNQ